MATLEDSHHPYQATSNDESYIDNLEKKEDSTSSADLHRYAPRSFSLTERDLGCPICMSLIVDPFVTPCGHTFCYTCISTHLQNGKNCPDCSHYLSKELIHPNFLLSDIIKHARATSVCQKSSSFNSLMSSIKHAKDGLKTSELSLAVKILWEAQQAAEQREKDDNMHLLLHFLQHSREDKVRQLESLQKELMCLDTDIGNVETAAKGAATLPPWIFDKAAVKLGENRRIEKAITSRISHGLKEYQQESEQGLLEYLEQGPNIIGGHESLHGNPTKKRRIASHFEDLQKSYLHMRSEKLKISKHQCTDHEQQQQKPIGAVVDQGLEDFSKMLSVLSTFNQLKTLATIPRPSLRQTSSIVSSLEFDRDGSLFATAGVSKRISIFDYNAVVGTPGVSVHCPIVELVTRSKLSCLSWNKYLPSHIASSDYEGVLTLWDVTTSSMIQEYEAHTKRIWSVDYCDADPTLLASGSDDCTVRLWSTKSSNAAGQLDLKANVCCVKWRPGSAYELAIGSADHQVYLYDIRQPHAPVSIFQGHRKAVSYVRFFNDRELVSSSTDSTLRLWNASHGAKVVREHERMYVGHENEKNFVGLSLSGQFLACGSESDEAFVYYKTLTKPVARQRFSSNDTDDEIVDKSFISAVCWRPGTHVLAVANSQGTIKLVELVNV